MLLEINTSTIKNVSDCYANKCDEEFCGYFDYGCALFANFSEILVKSRTHGPEILFNIHMVIFWHT